MARHKKGDAGERRTAYIGFQVTPTERARLEAAAQERGATLSEYGRALCFRRTTEPGPVVAAMRRDPDRKALLRELTALGNNVNQMQRLANTYRSLPHIAELEAIAGPLKAAIAKVIDGR